MLEGILKLPQDKTLLIAYSGGLDSHVLLHACAQLFDQKYFHHLKVVHIHHGLSPLADQWAEHCAEQACQLNLNCDVIRVNAQPKSGESPEATARLARYQALYEQLDNNSVLVTAHHKNDQVETLLLNLLRGSGIRGLAAMPFLKDVHYRPLLDKTRLDLEIYAKKHQLRWVEDSSNTNTDFDRNYLRHTILPLLLQRWPGALDTISRTTRHCQESEIVINELAEYDFFKVSIDHTALSHAPVKHCITLSLEQLKQLSFSRQKNLIRYALIQNNYPLPSDSQLVLLINTMLHARIDANPSFKWADIEVRRFKDHIYIFKNRLSKIAEKCLKWNDWHKPLIINNLAQCHAEFTEDIGIAEKWLNKGEITIRFRMGGERCKPYGRLHSQRLKKLLQEYNIPSWQRDLLPLLYIDNKLAAVIGVFYCEWVVGSLDEKKVAIFLKKDK